MWTLASYCFFLVACSAWCASQSVSAVQLVNGSNTALEIVNTSTTGMPIRMLTGPRGSLRALEIDPRGGTWMVGPVSIGAATGAAASEQLRIGSVRDVGGTGLTISMAGTTQSNGIAIVDIGSNGSDYSGITLSSQANGVGTGIRIGGGHQSGRPTLQTGIDITGGLGLRYNALNSGVGTAIEIGGTNAPRRGIDIYAAGTEHVGVIARANTSGTGLVGISQSLSSEPLSARPRTGVVGYAATNSTAGADTIIGSLGLAVRGGNGSTQTISVGVLGQSSAKSTQYGGSTIGIMGTTTRAPAPQHIGVGGYFVADSLTYALVALGGDVILGGKREMLPRPFAESNLATPSPLTRVHVYDMLSSGTTSLTGIKMMSITQPIALQGIVPTLDVFTSGVQRINVLGPDARIGGLRCADQGSRILSFLVLNQSLTVVNEDPAAEPEQRFLLPNGQNVLLEVEALHTFWYDTAVARWRLVR